jgi:phosphoribosylformylglycinamidine synthase PurS subunit
MKVTVEITRRPEIADPQGTTIKRALGELGHTTVDEVRVDRVIHLDVGGDDPNDVRERVEQMCRQLLSNPVLEDFTIEVNG